MSPLRVAIAGCGEVARRSHAPALAERSDVKVVGLCDLDADAIETVRRRTGLSCAGFPTVAAMLSAARPDVVHVCTPGRTHADVAAECLRAGAHVLVEKPPALSADAARGLVALAAARGLKIGAVLNTRRRSTTLDLKRALDAGVLGRIVKLHVTHHANIVFSESRYLWDERASKYLVYEFGIHLLDLLVYLCGPHVEIVHVSTTYQPAIDLTTGFDLVVRFADGATATLDLTCDSTRHSSYLTQVNVYGTGMDAFVRYFPPQCRLAAGVQHPIEILKSEVRSVVAVVTKVFSGRYLKHRNETHRIVIGEFIRWIRGESGFETELARVMPTMELLDAVAARIPAYTAPVEVNG